MLISFYTVASIFLTLFLIIMLISVLIGVPFLPTNGAQAKKMVALASLKPGMKVIDLGSGSGRLLFLAAADGAQATGYELNPFLVWQTRLASFLKKFSGLVSVRRQSIYTANVKEADVVFCFLMPKPMAKLESKLFAEMKPGSKIISYVFPFPNHTYISKEQGVMVYVV